MGGVLLPGCSGGGSGWGNKGERWLPYEAHEGGLKRGKLLGHKWLGPSRRRRPKLTRLVLPPAIHTRGTARLAPAPAEALVLVGSRAVAAPPLPAPVPIGGRGGLVSVAAPPVAAEAAAALLIGSAGSAHAALTLVLVHHVGVVVIGAAGPVTRPAT